jgi:hypothetical protein
MRSRKIHFLYLLSALTAACFFSYVTVVYTTEDAIQTDGHQNLSAAYYLVHNGVLGWNTSDPDNPAPKMTREPLPILALAAIMILNPEFKQPYTLAGVTVGPLAKTVKDVNAIWRFLAAFAVFMLCRELFPTPTVSAGVAGICLLVSEGLFFAQPPNVNTLFTEIPAAALMLLASWCAIRFTRAKTGWRATLLGVVLGALALTKAAFLYIGAVFILLLLLLDGKVLRSKSKMELVRAVIPYAIAGLVMTMTTMPWLARNFSDFGHPQMADRSETILAFRLALSEQPLLGQLYAFSPAYLKEHFIGPWTGYSDDDLKIGGKLEGLFRAQHKPLEMLADKMKAEGFTGDTRDWFRTKALNFVLQNPLRYLATIPIYAYKGMWFFQDGGYVSLINTKIVSALNLVTVLSFLGVFFGALIARNQVLVAAFGLAGGLFLFNSMFTHAISRFNSPITPFVILSLLWLLAALAWALQSKKVSPAEAH